MKYIYRITTTKGVLVSEDSSSVYLLKEGGFRMVAIKDLKMYINPKYVVAIEKIEVPEVAETQKIDIPS